MASAAESTEQSLKSIFETALDSFEDISNGNKTPREMQSLIKRTINQLEDATRLINIGQVFSSNELLEEVATENIRFLAIPAMLGVLVTKLETVDRVSILETAEVYFKDFVTRGKEYGLVPEYIKVEELISESSKIDLTRIVLDRNEKIRRYQEQKQLNSDLVELKKELERADDDVQRTYYTKFVKSFVFTAEEELKSIAMEKPLAQRKKLEKESGKKIEVETVKKAPPLKPIIITRNELQKKVYGAGYPSLPTMTVDEFYEDRVKQGIFPAGGSNHVKSLQQMADPEFSKRMDDEDDVRKETAEEMDDPEYLQKLRNTDEFKDDHRRGWGNRMNRS